MDGETPDWADEIFELLHKLNRRIHTMGIDLDNLTAQVAANTDVITKAVAALQAGSAGGTDPAALKVLTDSLRTADASLVAALAALGTTPPGTVPTVPTIRKQLVAAGTNAVALTALEDSMAPFPTLATLRGQIIAAGTDPTALQTLINSLPTS
jgi:hypothetical protein